MTASAISKLYPIVHFRTLYDVPRVWVSITRSSFTWQSGILLLPGVWRFLGFGSSYISLSYYREGAPGHVELRDWDTFCN